MKATTIFPTRTTSIKLFTTGATLGPIVDSLHNQCLLQYDIAPISLQWPEFMSQNIMEFSNPNALSSSILSSGETNYFFCSSWLIPPLLGFAYIVLGGILPRVIEIIVSNILPDSFVIQTQLGNKNENSKKISSVNFQNSNFFKKRAIQAVLSTAFIIRLSELLQTNSIEFSGITSSIPIDSHGSINLTFMILAALMQWIILDTSIISLIAATVTAVGGPLSELPFIALGCWHYIPQASDYFPLDSFSQFVASTTFSFVSVPHLALSGITGPCYFAVTMDAIALGRWFDSENECDDVVDVVVD